MGTYKRKNISVKVKVLPKILPSGEPDFDFYKPEFRENQEFSVAMDIKAKVDSPNGLVAGIIELHPGQIVTVNTGVFLELPTGWEAQIRPRSGLAKEYGISLANTPGTIDTGYRGEILLIVTNLRHLAVQGYGGYPAKSNRPFIIEDGMRLAQIAIREVPLVTLEFVDALSQTDRGDKGFGSTGVGK